MLFQTPIIPFDRPELLFGETLSVGHAGLTAVSSKSEKSKFVCRIVKCL